MLQLLMHLPPRLPPLPLLRNLQLRLRIKSINLRIIMRYEHLLHTSHIRTNIRTETPCHKSSRGVRAGEEMVRSAWAVMSSAFGDIIDCAVDGEEDGEVGIGSVVGF